MGKILLKFDEDNALEKSPESPFAPGSPGPAGLSCIEGTVLSSAPAGDVVFQQYNGPNSPFYQ